MPVFEPLRPGAPLPYERELIGDLSDIETALDLGNKTAPRTNAPYRNWYEDQNIQYTSIDWNGRDGALKYDMRYSITPEEIGGPFDLVCNIGTTEHVSDQEACWQNVHGFVGLGGLLVSHTPIGPGWENHGFWHPTLEWYQEFAEKNSYTVIRLEIGPWHPKSPRKMTYVKLQKLGFASVFQFPSTPIPRSPKRFNAEPQY